MSNCRGPARCQSGGRGDKARHEGDAAPQGDETMGLINALAISIGVLAAVATYLCLGTPLGLQVWALFVGWGAYYHTGGKSGSIGKVAINAAWGMLVAAITLFIVGSVGGSVLVTSIIVGISVVALVAGANVAILATIPAAVYGYASTAAFVLLTGVALTDVAALGKAAILVLVSIIVGTLFGFASEQGAGMLTKKS